MNVFDHLIKDTEIIGISAINFMENTPGSATTKLVSYSFRIYTHASSITIYSKEYGMNDSAKADAWLKQYLQVREKVAQQIGELQQ